MECYKHPEATAEASCVICQEPICTACRTWYAGYATCHMCAAREKLREARAQMSGGTAATVSVEAEPATGGIASGVKVILLASAAALAGAILWSRIGLETGWPLGILLVGLGWGIGATARAACGGPPGVLLRWFTLVVTAASVMLGFGLLQMGQAYRLHPDVASAAAGVPVPLQALLFTLAAPAKLGLLDWLFAYLGIFAAWRATRDRVRRPTADPAPQDAADSYPVPVAATEASAQADRARPFPGPPPAPMGPWESSENR